MHGQATRRMEAGRSRQRCGCGAAAHRPERVQLFDRRPGDHRHAARRGRRDRGRPALPDPPQRRGRGSERARQRLVRSRRHRRALAAAHRRRRSARAVAEGASHPRGAGGADADRALRPAARQRRRGPAGLGQGHRRGGESAGRDHDRAALAHARARRVHGRVQLRTRKSRRALPADPADEPALFGADPARAGSAGAPGAGERRGACAGVRQGRQGGRSDRARVSQAARRERVVQRRAAARPEGQRRPAARECGELSAQGRDRRGAADRQVRGGAVRHRRAQRRCGAAGDPAPCAGRVARRRRRGERAACGERRPGSRQAPAERRRHPGLVRQAAEVPRDADDGRRARPAEEPVVHDRRRHRCERPADQAQGRAPGRHARDLAARQRRGQQAPRAAAARRRRPAPVRSGRPALRRAGLSRRRDRVAAPRPGAARQARTDVRAHGRARHQPRRAFQAGPREQRRLGDDARPRQAGRRRRDRRQRLLWQAALERAQRRQGPGRRCPCARRDLRELPGRQRLFRQRPQGG